MPTSEPVCTQKHARMGHCQTSKQIHEFATGKAGFGSSMPVTSSGITMGPQIEGMAAGAQYRLDDPGVGLRNNGRRVLTYADVFNLTRTLDPREPSREIQLISPATWGDTWGDTCGQSTA
jgi:hypothetical protein